MVPNTVFIVWFLKCLFIINLNLWKCEVSVQNLSYLFGVNLFVSSCRALSLRRRVREGEEK